jgi:hypothetical protein
VTRLRGRQNKCLLAPPLLLLLLLLLLLRAHTMRRRRSDELPRFAGEDDAHAWPSPFRFRRRHVWILCGLLLACWLLYPSAAGAPTHGATNWTRYAYSLYATDSATLCHALLLFDALARLGSQADRVLFYPQHWDTQVMSAKDRDSQLLVLARDQYGVKLHPIPLLSVEGRIQGTHPRPGEECAGG